MTQSTAQDSTIIPDPALDSKTFKKLLMDQVRARGGTEAVDFLFHRAHATFRERVQVWKATVSSLTLLDLQTYIAVFVGETHPTQVSISSSVLTQYVNGGGNVYVYGGVDGNPAEEAAFFNPFLQVFGLSFDTTSYNGLTSVNVTSTHPIFDGLTGKTLGSGNGQDILDLATNPNAAIVQFQRQHGVYAVVNPVATPLVINQLGAAGPSNFTILSLGGISSEIHFSNGTVHGNAGVANTGEYDASGSTVLTGILYLGSQSTATTSGGAQIQRWDSAECELERAVRSSRQ